MPGLEWWIALSEITRNFGLILAGGLGLWLAWARVKAAGQQAEAAHEQSALARRDHVAELFNRAVGQLADERLEVRLGAIYTLRQIRRDFPGLAGAVFELLNAYIREETAGRDRDGLPLDVETILELLDEQARERKEKGP